MPPVESVALYATDFTTVRPLDWEVYKEGGNLELIDNENVHYSHFRASDARMYYYKDKLYAIFWQRTPQQEMYVGELQVDIENNKLVVVKSPVKLSFSHESNQVTQKNWSPFIYDHTYEGKGAPVSTSKVLYIYSAIPNQRIVHANESHDDGSRRAHTVAVTTMHKPDPRDVWLTNFGAVHGGSNALLINTKYGPKYVTFYHSSANYMISWCGSYFMGAYLFDAQPPFAITHITTEPIVTPVLYNESTEGWSFRAVDYIMFPTSIFLLSDDILYLCLGHNDKSGWLMQFSLKGLVEELEPVESVTHVNRLADHLSYATSATSTATGTIS